MSTEKRDVTARGLLCVLWQSPTPNANGRYWRILSNGHVERMPRGWKPENER